jgi:hypothetical protein
VRISRIQLSSRLSPLVTVDRLMSILNRLGSRVEVKVRVRPAEPLGEGVPL